MGFILKTIRNLVLLSVMLGWAGWVAALTMTCSTKVVSMSPNPSVVGQAVLIKAAPSGCRVTDWDGSANLYVDGVLVQSGWGYGSSIDSFTYAFPTAGAHVVTVTYRGPGVPVTQTVNKSASTTTLTASPGLSALGQAVMLTASVSGYSPTGTVTFKDGATVLGTGTLAAGSATFNATFSTAGTHSLTAVYGGDTNNTTSISAATAQTVKLASSTTLSSTPSSTIVGQTVALTTTVTGATPTGTVTFKDGATVLGAGTLTAGSANFNATFSTAGTHSLTAVYGGDANNFSSTSALVGLSVSKAITTTALTVTPNPSVAGQAIILNAMVTGAMPSGIITFMDGATTLGTAPLSAGTATLNYTFINVGSHTLSAVYSGDTNNLSSTSAAVAETITIATSATSLTASPNLVATGQAANLIATVSGALPNGTVTFKDGGGAILGTSTIGAGMATLNYTYNAVGAYSLSAEYSGDPNNTLSVSVPVVLTVKLPSSTVLTATPAALLANQNVALTANVTGTNPTGTVTFNEGAAVLGTVTLAAGTGTLNYAFTTGGAHTPTATYNGDGNHVTSTSGAVSIAVAADQISFFHNDVAGTPVASTDTTGALLWKESYRPYGDPMQPPAADNNIWFTGKPYDKDSGLTYMGARYYDPLVGRFVGMDPEGFNENNLHSFNRYTYANNNPLKYVDPDGRSPLTVLLGWVVGGALTGAGTAGAMNAGMQYMATGDVQWNGAGGVRDAMADGAVIGAVLGPVFGAEASAARGAANAAGKEIGILRDAAQGKGNFGLGSATKAESDKLGRAWVGDGATIASDGTTLVSADKLRQYRPPSFKPNLDKTQSNFEQKFSGQKSNQWQSNGHLDIKD